MSRLQVLDHRERGVEIRGAGFWRNGQHVWITRGRNLTKLIPEVAS